MRNLILLFACAVSSLYAQGTTSHFIKRPSFQTGIIFQHWSTAGNQELREIVMPLVIHYAVSERFSVSVLNTPARAEYQAPGVSSRLTAFTDTKLSLALVMNDERLLLNFGINIPSGQTKLDPATELPVAQQITTHALTMPMNYFGGGFDANASIAGAFETG
ncbi:MAG: hypothetical protein ONA90_05720, partial [candidate division KSB1 bacterium]|nr:hypothetical protein [candidate division KSB1 bacterium]